MIIEKLVGFQVLDSRGRPTVAASIVLSDGSVHTAKVPSGASTGKHEALELRDFNTPRAEKYFAGNSVFGSVAKINTEISPLLVGKHVDFVSVDALLNELDPSENHGVIGANTKLAISLSAAKAQAHNEGKSLARLFSPTGKLKIPMPMVNILSGGAHANRSMDIQDVLVVPIGAHTFSEALSWVSAIREVAAVLGRESGYITHLVADEGGLGIPFTSISSACAFVEKCISQIGLRTGRDVSLALDFASTQFFHDGIYDLINEGLKLEPRTYISYISNLIESHNIISIEDPFSEDDWESWQEFSRSTTQKLQLLGDDFFTTNLARLSRGIKEKAANSILIKVNQNGLISGTHEVLKAAQTNGFATVVSARSGETEDDWLADLAVGWEAEQIKVGSTHGSERNTKWNRLLELEATEDVVFASPFS
jgi:enolase